MGGVLKHLREAICDTIKRNNPRPPYQWFWSAAPSGYRRASVRHTDASWAAYDGGLEVIYGRTRAFRTVVRDPRACAHWRWATGWSAPGGKATDSIGSQGGPPARRTCRSEIIRTIRSRVRKAGRNG